MTQKIESLKYIMKRRMRKQWRRLVWWLQRTFSPSLRRDLAKQCPVCGRKFQCWVGHNSWYRRGIHFCSPECVIVWLTSEQGVEYWGVHWKKEFIEAIWTWELHYGIAPDDEKREYAMERISKRIDLAIMCFSSSSSSSSSDSLWSTRTWNQSKIQTD